MAFATVIASDLEKTSVPLSVIPPAPSDPTVLPLPTCRVPALIVVAPEFVLAPVNIKVPDPDCVSDPVPVMAVERMTVSERLKARVALSVIEPDPKVPIVPALPIWSVPALIVVEPE
jgi:hypothetical protein